MSYASTNSSTTLSQNEVNQYTTLTSAEQQIAVQEQRELPSNAEDLYYGIEELLDGLPRVWTRSLLYVLISFVIVVIPWATFSKIDEVGSARGRIEPRGATQKLDAQVSGRVQTVMVQEGDRVKAGQVLLKLESDVLQTDLQGAMKKLSGLQNQLSQMDKLKKQVNLTLYIQDQQNQSQVLEKISQLNQAKLNLDIKQSTYNLQNLEKQALVNQSLKKIYAAQSDFELAKQRLSIDKRQVNRYSVLIKDGAVSGNQVDQIKKEELESNRVYRQAQSEIEQSKLRLAEEINRYKTTIDQLKSEIEQAKLRQQEVESSYQISLQAGKLASLKIQEQLKNLDTQITTLKTQITETVSQIASLQLQLQQRVVRSPVDGVVFEFPIKKPGVVVQPSQRIAQIAPKNADLVLKAQIPIQDSGFLKLGLPAKIKFDAYPFQQHGIVKGKVTWISPDSKASQTPQGDSEAFELEISLEQQYIQNGNKNKSLSAGQTGTAEIIIRQQRVIDLVLAPFKKLKKGSLEY